MPDDKRTKAQLAEALHHHEKDLAAAEERLKQFDPEARAIAACVAAIKGIPNPEQSRHRGQGHWMPHDDLEITSRQRRIARVLDYLRDRYGLPSHHELEQRAASLAVELEDARDQLESVRQTLQEG